MNAMTYRGTVKNGVVVLENAPALREGAHVRVEVPEKSSKKNPSTRKAKTRLGKMLLKHAGKATRLPSDSARNHEHYLYGAAKR
jgi:hypothetical protein